MITTLLHHRIAHIFLILTIGILAYSNTFQAPFVLDDLASITDNPVIQDLGNFAPGGVGFDSNSRRWLGYLTFAVNYHYSGLDVTGYHIFNLAVHLSAALLLYFLVCLTFRTPHLAGSRIAPQAGTVALLASLLFTVHPVQTQAVTYIVQRLTSLSTFFYLFAVICYVAARLKLEEPKPKATKSKTTLKDGQWISILLIIGSVTAAILAMKTKEIAFTLPLAVVC
jgi:hypothetical protein